MMHFSYSNQISEYLLFLEHEKKASTKEALQTGRCKKLIKVNQFKLMMMVIKMVNLTEYYP